MKNLVVLCLVVIVTSSTLVKAWRAVGKEELETDRKKKITCVYTDCIYWYFQYGHQLLGETMTPEDSEVGNNSYALDFFESNVSVRISIIKDAFRLCLRLLYTKRADCEGFFIDFRAKGYPVVELMGFCLLYSPYCSVMRNNLIIPYYIEKKYLRTLKLNFPTCFFSVRTLEDLLLQDSIELSQVIIANNQSHNNVCNCKHAHALGELYRNLKSDSEKMTLTSFLQLHCIKADGREGHLVFDPITIDRLSSIIATLNEDKDPTENEFEITTENEDDLLELASLILKEESKIAKVFQNTTTDWQVEPFILMLKNSYPLLPTFYSTIIDIVNTAIHYEYTLDKFLLFSHATNYTCSASTETLDPKYKTKINQLQLRIRKEVLTSIGTDKDLLSHFVEVGKNNFQEQCAEIILRSTQDLDKE